MPRKTTILIVILALITGILIFLAVRSDNQIRTVTNITPTSVPPVEPYATLSFSQGVIDASTITGEVSVDIILDTGGKSVAGAQAELSYDPSVFTNVKIESSPTSLFGQNPNILFQSVDPAQGRISFAAGIPISSDEVIGVGPIATLKFRVIAPSTGTSQMSFLPKSSVQTLSARGSVLLNSSPLQIISGASQ